MSYRRKNENHVKYLLNPELVVKHSRTLFYTVVVCGSKYLTHGWRNIYDAKAAARDEAKKAKKALAGGLGTSLKNHTHTHIHCAL
jgi:hypothetical protein